MHITYILCILWTLLLSFIISIHYHFSGFSSLHPFFYLWFISAAIRPHLFCFQLPFPHPCYHSIYNRGSSSSLISSVCCPGLLQATPPDVLKVDRLNTSLLLSADANVSARLSSHPDSTDGQRQTKQTHTHTRAQARTDIYFSGLRSNRRISTHRCTKNADGIN